MLTQEQREEFGRTVRKYRESHKIEEKVGLSQDALSELAIGEYRANRISELEKATGRAPSPDLVRKVCITLNIPSSLVPPDLLWFNPEQKYDPKYLYWYSHNLMYLQTALRFDLGELVVIHGLKHTWHQFERLSFRCPGDFTEQRNRLLQIEALCIEYLEQESPKERTRLGESAAIQIEKEINATGRSLPCFEEYQQEPSKGEEQPEKLRGRIRRGTTKDNIWKAHEERYERKNK